MSLKGTAKIHVFGPNERDVDIEKDWQAEFDAAYVRVHGEGKCPFPVYAGKGGGWSGAGHKVYAFLGYARVEGKNVLGVVANVSADRSVGRLYRQNAFVELLEIVHASRIMVRVICLLSFHGYLPSLMILFVRSGIDLILFETGAYRVRYIRA